MNDYSIRLKVFKYVKQQKCEQTFWSMIIMSSLSCFCLVIYWKTEIHITTKNLRNTSATLTLSTDFAED